MKLLNVTSPPPVTSITPQFLKTIQDHFFVGQTGLLSFGGSIVAWGGLFNPLNSGVNVVINDTTLSDLGVNAFTADLYLGSVPPGRKITSSLTTATNLSLPLAKPKAKLKFNPAVRGVPQGGTFAFIRRVETDTTQVIDVSGRIILPPGGTFFALLKTQVFTQSRIGFAWWEERIK
ncbi:DUF6143 family protein [Mechercharimyces sp. CAU 1602]|uniref:DUF6143 family protein n=1 Tax=Mechercharimyces sp. CAU 1602 TaxID=2973933 RepID=UPI002161950B|nr:DUF6143 family protein [Mechercharimyces sp. CAU 1602]MCS1351971.1 DUF6143 family protein [Mechercharimyces sp. CAU 1602]